MYNCRVHKKVPMYSCGNVECAIKCGRCFDSNIEIMSLQHVFCPFCQTRVQLTPELLNGKTHANWYKLATQITSLLLNRHGLIESCGLAPNDAPGDQNLVSDAQSDDIDALVMNVGNTESVQKEKFNISNAKKTKLIDEIKMGKGLKFDTNILACDAETCKSSSRGALHHMYQSIPSGPYKCTNIECNQKKCGKCLQQHPASDDCEPPTQEFWQQLQVECPKCNHISYKKQHLDIQWCMNCSIIFNADPAKPIVFDQPLTLLPTLNHVYYTQMIKNDKEREALVQAQGIDFINRLRVYIKKYLFEMTAKQRTNVKEESKPYRELTKKLVICILIHQNYLDNGTFDSLFTEQNGTYINKMPASFVSIYQTMTQMTGIEEESKDQ